MRAAGYHDIPDFPEVAPDPAARNVSEPLPPSPLMTIPPKKQPKNKSFYSDSDSSPEDGIYHAFCNGYLWLNCAWFVSTLDSV